MEFDGNVEILGKEENKGGDRGTKKDGAGK